LRIVELDATDWKTPVDFVRAIQRALDAPEWCGSNVDAINELMIWGLRAGELPPPYVVKIFGVSATPQEVQDYIALQARCVQQAREEKMGRDGYDTEVRIEFA